MWSRLPPTAFVSLAPRMSKRGMPEVCRECMGSVAGVGLLPGISWVCRLLVSLRRWRWFVRSSSIRARRARHSRKEIAWTTLPSITSPDIWEPTATRRTGLGLTFGAAGGASSVFFARTSVKRVARARGRARKEGEEKEKGHRISRHQHVPRGAPTAGAWNLRRATSAARGNSRAAAAASALRTAAPTPSRPPKRGLRPESACCPERRRAAVAASMSGPDAPTPSGSAQTGSASRRMRVARSSKSAVEPDAATSARSAAMALCALAGRHLYEGRLVSGDHRLALLRRIGCQLFRQPVLRHYDR